MSKMSVEKLIEETVYEMLKEGNKSLIGLMMSQERNLGSSPQSQKQFLDETIQILKERLGVPKEPNKPSQFVLEQRRMRKLSGINEEE